MNAQSDLLLDAEHVRPARFESTAGLDLTCRRRSMTVLTGPSSVASSAWLETLAALGALAGGRLRLLDGEDEGPHNTALRQKIGYVDTRAPLLSTLDVRMNVMLPRLYHYGESKPVARRYADRVLDRLDYMGPRDVLPARLGALETLQVLLARALALDPSLLFVDEPFALDTISAWRTLAQHLGALALDDGRGVLVATRNLEFAARHADQLVFVAADGHATPYPGWPEFRATPEPAAFLADLPFALESRVS